MTNTIALYLGIIVVAAIGLDIVANDGTAVMFMVRKFLDMVDWVEFWR
jgi:hypothetical protein